MSVINQVEALKKHGMACQNCDIRMAEVFITICRGGGGTGYSYCKECAFELGTEILMDCDKLDLSMDTTL